jgi:hypothetical protein
MSNTNSKMSGSEEEERELLELILNSARGRADLETELTKMSITSGNDLRRFQKMDEQLNAEWSEILGHLLRPKRGGVKEKMQRLREVWARAPALQPAASNDHASALGTRRWDAPNSSESSGKPTLVRPYNLLCITYATCLEFMIFTNLLMLNLYIRQIASSSKKRQVPACLHKRGRRLQNRSTRLQAAY